LFARTRCPMRYLSVDRNTIAGCNRYGCLSHGAEFAHDYTELLMAYLTPD